MNPKNPKEKKKDKYVSICPECKEVIEVTKWREQGIEKGKQEAQKEELEFLLIMKEHITTNNCPLPTLRLNDRISELQKEIKNEP